MAVERSIAVIIILVVCTLLSLSTLGCAFNLLQHYQTNTPSPLIPLKTEIELVLDFNEACAKALTYPPPDPIPEGITASPLFNTVQKLRGPSNRGRDAVQAQIQAIQRLVIQLDRSDGRSDIGSDILAQKYYDFLCTCLRSDGPAWTASLGPLEYIGMRLKDFITEKQVTDQVIRVIDMAGICQKMGSCMLDLNVKDRSAMETLDRMTQDKLQSILDLSLAMTRLSIRYAIFKEQLETENPKEVADIPFQGIEILMTNDFVSPLDAQKKNPLLEVLIPANRRLNSILIYDMLVDELDLPIPGSNRILVRKDDLTKFIEKHSLAPKNESA